MAKTVVCHCPQCQKEFLAYTSRVNRAQKFGAPLYCNKTCACLARRLSNPPTKEERKAAKAEYDRRRREEKAEEIKAKKAAYFKRTYNPEKAAVDRKKRAHLHAEYCRRPDYKKWKADYDRRYRATKEFGDYAETFFLLQDIEREIESRSTRYEIYRANGTLNKAQTRRRSL